MVFGKDSRSYLGWGLQDKRLDVLSRKVPPWERDSSGKLLSQWRAWATPTAVLSFQMGAPRGSGADSLSCWERGHSLCELLRQACKMFKSVSCRRAQVAFVPSCLPGCSQPAGTDCSCLWFLQTALGHLTSPRLSQSCIPSLSN